ncbi:MAG: DsbA family protein [Solirubrobacteraceae bacterium]
MSDLRSAPVPEPGDGDHRRGPDGAPLVIVYADFECPYCAAQELRLRALPVQVVFRHFPVRSSHPRAWPAACAAEAASSQGRFWEMHDALFSDQGRLDDPHLWERARRLRIDLPRFDADRRGEAVRERVSEDFRAGVRAGVVTTPTLFAWAGARAVPVTLAELERGGSQPAQPPAARSSASAGATSD